MRKFFILTIAALTLTSIANAKPVTLDQALMAAEKLLGDSPYATRGSHLTRVYDKTHSVSASASATASTATATSATAEAFEPYYIFNRTSGGWIMLSGDDTLPPLIAWSDTGSFTFDNMPDNVRYIIDLIRTACFTTASTTQTPEWSELLDADSQSGIIPNNSVEVIKYLHTNEWHQYEPFSLKYPIDSDNNRHYVCGCVPLGLATVVAYYGYAHPNGTVSYTYDHVYGMPITSESSFNLSSPERDYQLDVLKDLKTYLDVYNASEDVIESIAQLIFDCGVLMNATYYGMYSGTSASALNVIKAFGEHMGYRKDARLLEANTYSTDTWKEMLISEISADRPLMYRANDSDGQGGHFFILDGYGSYAQTTVFHFNFGWGGMDNGYYNYYYLNPDFDLSSDQAAIFGFEPDYDQNTTFSPLITLLREGDYSGLTFANNEKTLLNIGNIYNKGNANWEVKKHLAVFRVKKDGSKDVDPLYLYDSDSIELRPNYYFPLQQKKISLPDDCSYGDYLAAYYKRNDDSDWELITADKYGSIISKLPVMGSAFIKVKDSYTVGEYFQFETENRDFTYDYTNDHTYWVIDGQEYPYPFKEAQLNRAGKVEIEAHLMGDTLHVLKTTINVE